MIITIDGPAASGKSSVARMLADRLDRYYLNSGLLYRAVAYILMTQYRYDDYLLANPSTQQLVQSTDTSCLTYCYQKGYGATVLWRGQDITSYLKTPVIDRASSLLGTSAIAREYLNQLQRKVAQDHSIVAEGRDAGSIVFPDAQEKFFLTASPEIRAARWRELQKKQGHDISFDQAIASIIERDKRDTMRHIAPLVVPQGAIVIHNDHLTLTETVEKIIAFLC